MKIGILGSAAVGQTLSKAFVAEGHTVRMGTRNVRKEELLEFQKLNPSVGIGTFEEVAAFGELIVLATSGTFTEDAIKLAGIHHFKHKIVIDTTNPIEKEPPVNGVLKFFTDYNRSLLEILQHLLVDAKLVKAFNSVGAALMYRPDFTEGKPTMFICGNDSGAKKTVTDILQSFGWEAEDMGKAEAARAIEPLCILWCIPGFLKNDWHHAFSLLKA